MGIWLVLMGLVLNLNKKKLFFRILMEKDVVMRPYVQIFKVWNPMNYLVALSFKAHY